ncbi:hypothetical protein BKA63DRAFT_511659 [Paraphoma chrysanthemicola]|nr:hypothetical protein BKA63DRAFT_511659 [Paraphoma chrysanthemicola]
MHSVDTILLSMMACRVLRPSSAASCCRGICKKRGMGRPTDGRSRRKSVCALMGVIELPLRASRFSASIRCRSCV